MRLKGFMGRTHAILSVCLLFACMLIPLDIFKQSFWLIKDNFLLFFVAIILTIGGALLVDLDSSVSTAGAELGIFGRLCTVFMQTVASVIWSVYHGKHDRMPPTWHRYLWHAPIIGIGISCMLYFGMPSGDYTIFSSISSSISQGTFVEFLQKNTVIGFFMLLAFMSALCGSAMVVSKAKRILPIPFYIKYILPALVLIYVCTADYNTLRLLGLCIGSGYLFHCLEDYFCDSGIPLLWPIPIGHKVWKKFHFIMPIETGGVINTIIDFIALVLAVILLVAIFIGR